MIKTFILKKYTSLIDIRWFKVLDIIVSQILSAIFNPSYVFFSIIALVLGTTGVWIEYFPYGVEGIERFDPDNSKLAIFTFCIATLGYLATESYFDNQKNSDLEDGLKRNLGVFSWSVCLFLTFYSYVGCENPMLGFWSTITFWLLVNIDKPAFNKADKKAMKNMDSTSSDADGIGGAGL
ncbi:hypothetical protein N9N07_04175 [Pseudomonadales bacterium]|nr:hypothetical protein [Pseudomonadales bacterium]